MTYTFSITNPAFDCAEHFLFFFLISEINKSRDTIIAASVIQGFAITFYNVLTLVTYACLGQNLAMPALSSRESNWAKAAHRVATLNVFMAESL